MMLTLWAPVPVATYMSNQQHTCVHQAAFQLYHTFSARYRITIYFSANFVASIEYSELIIS